MTAHSCWIYDRHTRCIFHRDYDTQVVNTENDSDNAKLLYGMLQSLRAISQQLTHENQSVDYQSSLALSSSNRVRTIKTLLYSIHVKETLSGMKIVILTDNNPLTKIRIRSILDTIYTTLIVPHLSANPMAVKSSPADSIIIRNKTFVAGIDHLVQSV